MNAASGCDPVYLRLCIERFGIPRFADCQGRIDEHFEESVQPDEFSRATH